MNVVDGSSAALVEWHLLRQCECGFVSGRVKGAQAMQQVLLIHVVRHLQEVVLLLGDQAEDLAVTLPTRKKNRLNMEVWRFYWKR